MSRKLWLFAVLLVTLACGALLILSFDNSKRLSSIALVALHSVIFLVSFHIGIAIEQGLTSWRLEINPWVKDVEDMDYCCNPMFYTWLYHSDPERWAKWSAGACVVASLYIDVFVVFFIAFGVGWNLTFGEHLAGFLASFLLFMLYAYRFYKIYAKRLTSTRSLVS